MPSEAGDARALLKAAPEEYVAERTRLVKEARADGDKGRASFYQSLKRPTMSVWAVLAAGEDTKAVHGIIAATAELGEIQAARSNPGALSAATQRRRKALEALVDRAVAALARTDSAAETRRAEIRGMIDQLSRHPELADSWIDGTLRDLPDDAMGFAAFTGMEVTTQGHRAKPAKPRTAGRKKPAAPPQPEDKPLPPAARAAQAQHARKARQDVATAARELANAERRVATAAAALRKAEEEMQSAEDARATAQRRHEAATKRLEDQ